MILENNIVDAQEDLTDIIEEFDHNHVLRTMLTPFDGLPLQQNSGQDGLFRNQFEFEIPVDEHLWKVEDLEIIVFVHGPLASGEVIQAQLAKLPL